MIHFFLEPMSAAAACACSWSIARDIFRSRASWTVSVLLSSCSIRKSHGPGAHDTFLSAADYSRCSVHFFHGPGADDAMPYRVKICVGLLP